MSRYLKTNHPPRKKGKCNVIRALIVDDHPVVVCGIEMILGQADDIEAVTHAHTGYAALCAVESGEYNVVILDIDLPDMNGIDVLKQIRKIKPSLPVLVLSIYDEKVYAVRAIQSGASGYVSKDSVTGTLITAIYKVCNGGKYISETLAERLACAMTHGDKLPHESLSNREYEVFRMLALGQSVTEIARELSIGHQTVSTHRKRILEKMDLQSNTDIAHYAIFNGLVDSA